MEQLAETGSAKVAARGARFDSNKCPNGKGAVDRLLKAGILDKQESHRFRCVRYDAGSFPTQSTQLFLAAAKCAAKTTDTVWLGCGRGSTSEKSLPGPKNAVNETALLAYSANDQHVFQSLTLHKRPRPSGTIGHKTA